MSCEEIADHVYKSGLTQVGTRGSDLQNTIGPILRKPKHSHLFKDDGAPKPQARYYEIADDGVKDIPEVKAALLRYEKSFVSHDEDNLLKKRIGHLERLNQELIARLEQISKLTDTTGLIGNVLN